MQPQTPTLPDNGQNYPTADGAQAPGQPFSAADQSMTAPMPSMPAMPPVDQPAGPAAAAPDGQSAPAGSAAPNLGPNVDVAADNDLIEHEWVDKVEQAFDSYANDPAELAKVFMQLKADYLQKRYGKTLKMGE